MTHAWLSRRHSSVCGLAARSLAVGTRHVQASSSDADADDRHHRYRPVLAAAVATIGLTNLFAHLSLRIGLGLFFMAEQFIGLFTDDPATLEYAADFARVYGLASRS